MAIDEHLQLAEARIEEALVSGASHLNLGGLGLSRIPDSLWQLTQLKLLDLSYNRLEDLPETIGELRLLQNLYLHSNILTYIPESLGLLTELRAINLYENELRLLPSSLGQLGQLQSLSISKNVLFELPISIGGLASLVELIAGNNQLRHLPESLTGLQRLKHLDASKNQLTFLPESISHLSNVQSLDVSENQLISVPDSLGHLTSLLTLKLRGNSLLALPESIGELKNLQTLDLTSNRLQTLPASMRELKALEYLYLHDNLSLGLPEELLGARYDANASRTSTRNGALLGYYFTHHKAAEEEGTEPLMEAKVLVLGEASVGKTCLIAAITEGIRRRELDGKGTSGIVRKIWGAPLTGKHLSPPSTIPSEETLRLNFWDFGGQEIYHSAHTLFLTHRAVYLIVVSKRENDRQNNVDYWLRMAASFGGPEAVAYVVVNKSDETVGHAPDEQALMRKYSPQLRGILYTSCDDLHGVVEVRERLAHEALRLNGVRLPVAKTWLSIKRKLETMAEHTLSMREWETLCEENGVVTAEAKRELLYLCDRLGTIRYFPTAENDPPELRDTAILNPEWVTLGIYALLDDPELKARGGLVDRAHMARILERRGYPGSQERIIEEVMRRFDLLYDSASHRVHHRMLIPLMLPAREPALEWPKEHTLEFVYQYDVVPAGLIPAFIARMHQHISTAVPMWRHGCVLEVSGCRVRVIGDAERKRVSISVIGEPALCREVLDQVRFTFDDLHDAVENLPVEHLIPVPGHPDAPLLDYDFVRSLEWEGKAEFRTKGGTFGKTIKVSVREALDGVRGVARQRRDEAQGQEVTRTQVRVTQIERVDNYTEQNMSKIYSGINATNGGIVGDGNTQEINVHSGNQNADVLPLLLAMRREFDRLPAEAAASARPYVEAIEAEAKKEKPDKSFLELSRNGLVEAAKACAGMAPFLLSAANEVVAWFSKHR